MKDGDYSMQFGCDGHAGQGSLTLVGPVARGGDERFDVEGQITESGNKLIGALTIDLAPGISGNSFIKGMFGCPMTGTSEGQSFALYGLGPLGIIIEIKCQWAGPIPIREVERNSQEVGAGLLLPSRHRGAFDCEERRAPNLGHRSSHACESSDPFEDPAADD